MSAPKATCGNYFEDFSVGQTIQHATPRTVRAGDLALYTALYGDRRPLHSSDEFARAVGYPRSPAHDLLVFHIVFGKTVGDVSLNAVANLGYADVRFLRPVFPGDTLRAETEVIGLREASSGKHGVVYVRSHGFNQREEEVLRFTRWVLVNKRDPDTRTGVDDVPTLPDAVPAGEVPIPPGLDLTGYDPVAWATGGSARYDDYRVGEVIHHVDGMTLDEADHTFATRLYQNTAKVHFNAHAMRDSRFGRRLIYGGHVISVAHALAFNGLNNAVAIAAWNAGTHANPCFAGDTLYAWTEVLDKDDVPARDDLGALRLRLVAVKNADPTREEIPLRVEVDGKSRYDERVVLDLDYWTLVAR
ncbi:MAG: MaoC family dehydratase [Deltaproteobacteria bacterium]|nr:MAG: MaoC family dehydratase [Deltaproteobacteria bacterium]